MGRNPHSPGSFGELLRKPGDFRAQAGLASQRFREHSRHKQAVALQDAQSVFLAGEHNEVAGASACSA